MVEQTGHRHRRRCGDHEIELSSLIVMGLAAVGLNGQNFIDFVVDPTGPTKTGGSLRGEDTKKLAHVAARQL